MEWPIEPPCHNCGMKDIGKRYDTAEKDEELAGGRGPNGRARCNVGQLRRNQSRYLHRNLECVDGDPDWIVDANVDCIAARGGVWEGLRFAWSFVAGVFFRWTTLFSTLGPDLLLLSSRNTPHGVRMRILTVGAMILDTVQRVWSLAFTHPS